MAVVMKMKWDGIGPEQYDASRDLVRWETEGPDGAIFHVAWFEDGNLRVLDVWESPEQFQAFVDNRLTPGLQQLGIEGQPHVEFQPAHCIFDAAHGEARS